MKLRLRGIFAPLPAVSLDAGAMGLIEAGLFVGVCGLSRFSLRSQVNLLAFIEAGFATVFMLRLLF